MNHLILKREIIDKIKCDPILYGSVAYTLDVSIVSMPRIFATDSPRLTQASVLKLIKEHLGIENESELLEMVTDTEMSTKANVPLL